jgi:glycosyltransferase involved in cell wall biosynthesis
MAVPRHKITALIPCYNEASGIADVIRSFPTVEIEQYGYDLEIIVIDNNSSDDTANVARSLGVTVLHEAKKGKGNAMRTGFFSISSDTDYVVMLDGDATYRPEEIIRMVEPLRSGFANVIIGSRLGGKITNGSMKGFNRLGNWFYSHIVRLFYRVNVTDVLTGYFAWERSAIERLRPHLTSEGFAIEMEMVTKMARLGEEIYSVPISYHPRAGESSLRPIYDGSRILLMFARNLFWKPKTARVERIAFVSDTVAPFFHGGKEQRLYEITKRLVQPGREVHIYTMKWWDGPKSIIREGVHLHAISKLHPLYTKDGRRSMTEAIFFGFATFKMLFKRFDVLDVDHIPFFPIFAARIVTWLRFKKLHATWHEVWGRAYWFEYLKGPLGLFGFIIEELAFMMPNVIISNSEHTTTRLRLAGVTAEIKTIPLGVDLDYIYTAECGSDTSDVIYVGRLLNHKNVDLLIRAIEIVKQSVPNVLCRIVGNGPEKERLEALVGALSLQENIIIQGRVGEMNELYSLMKASKMLVLPSVREGFGLVVVEANAAGLPVVTVNHSDNAASSLIREGVNGFVANADEKDIAEKILRVLEIRATMEPRLEIEKYDWKTVVQNLQRVFR